MIQHKKNYFSYLRASQQKKKIVLIESLIGNFSFPDKEKCSAWFITKIRIWTNLETSWDGLKIDCIE